MSIWFKNYKIEEFKDSSINIDAHLGIEFLEIGRDFFKARMPVDKRTKQPLGLLHGGHRVCREYSKLCCFPHD